jgi:cobalt-zinc-cadmium efflux system outer membrane protein
MPAKYAIPSPTRWLWEPGAQLRAMARMFAFRTILTVALLCAGMLSSVPAAGLSRDAAIEKALSSNLELKVAAIEIERAKSRLRWAGRLSNPEIELSHSNDLIGQNDNEGELELAFSQRFPVTSRLDDEKEVLRRDVELAEIEFRIRQRQLAFEVDKAWLELRAAQKSEIATAGLITVNQEVSKFLAGRAEVGEASSLDVVQASLNGKLLEQELGISKAATAAATARLKQLMGAEQKATISIASARTFPKQAPASSLKLETVFQNRPDYRLLLASKDLGDAQLALAMSQRWDDLAVKVFLQHERAVDEPGGLERNSFVGVGVSIPLPLRNKNEQAIEAAELDIEKARRARAAKMFAIHSELRRALEARTAAYKLAKGARGEALPLARKNVEEFKQAQQNGQASLLQVQQAQAQLLQLENAALELQKNYDLIDAEVRFIAGTYPIPEPPSTSK